MYDRPGGDHRSGAPARRKSKTELLKRSEPLDDPDHAWCVHGCQTLLDFTTIERDKIDPRIKSYAQWNIQASCRDCNRGKSDKFVGTWLAPVWL